MHDRVRNWLFAAGALAVVWIGQPIWSRNLDYFLERRGWEKALDTAVGSMSEWMTGALALFRLDGFWGGAFTVLAIWGCLEGFYAVQRWRQNGGESAGTLSLSPYDETVQRIDKAITQVQVETNVERKLFPDRNSLDETAVRKFVFDFIKSLAMSGEVVLFETRETTSRLVAIESSALAVFDFKETNLGTIRFAHLVSPSGAKMHGLFIRKSDIGTVVGKLRQAAPLVRALPTPDQP